MINDIAEQLVLGNIGFAEAKEKVDQLPMAVRGRARRKVEAAYEMMTEPLDLSDDLMFNHSGLCQTSLPHRQLAAKNTVWERRNGRFTLMVRPGVMRRGETDKEADLYIGVPYGSKARLIMFHLQTEGLKSRTVSLGRNLSSFLRSLGLEVRGGPRGTIRPIREQTLRIGRCTFTMQWDSEGAGGKRTVITDSNIVEGMEIRNISSEDWSGEVQLAVRFHENLLEHAVPLDKRGIAMLSDNSLALDLYALLAHRLPRLNAPLKISWAQLLSQLGSVSDVRDFTRRVRALLPHIARAYPAARIEPSDPERGRSGYLMLYPSPPPVPKKMISGFTAIEGTKEEPQGKLLAP